MAKDHDAWKGEEGHMEPDEHQHQQQPGAAPPSAHEKMRKDREFVMEFLEFLAFMQDEATHWNQAPAPTPSFPSSSSSSSAESLLSFPTPPSSIPGPPSFSSPSSSPPVATSSPQRQHQQHHQRRRSGSSRPPGRRSNSNPSSRRDERSFSLPSLQALPSYPFSTSTSSSSTSSSSTSSSTLRYSPTSSPLFGSTSFPCPPCAMLAGKAPPSPPPHLRRSPTFNLSADLPLYSTPLDDASSHQHQHHHHHHHEEDEDENRRLRGGVGNGHHQHQQQQHHHQQPASGYVATDSHEAEEDRRQMEVAEGEREEEGSLRQRPWRS